MSTSTYASIDHSTATEKTLIAEALSGDNAAFSELVSRNQNRLYAAMLRVAHSADMAEEIVQDTFVQAYLKLHTFRQTAAFSSWLYRIAFNKFLSMKRTRNTASLDGMAENNDLHIVDPCDSAERACERFETRQQVTDALARLDNKSRSILVLREMNGLSYQEIGDVLRLKPGTVRSQLSRARSKLVRELSPAGEARN
jgi:RNA polymerase sigma-70 factor (ECF subfamily)